MNIQSCVHSCATQLTTDYLLYCTVRCCRCTAMLRLIVVAGPLPTKKKWKMRASQFCASSVAKIQQPCGRHEARVTCACPQSHLSARSCDRVNCKHTPCEGCWAVLRWLKADVCPRGKCRAAYQISPVDQQ